jgi:hypothetical protein
LNEKELRLKLGKAGKENVMKDFSLAKMSVELERVYKSL